MSISIPQHNLFNSYNNEKLANLEAETYQKLQDFYHVYEKQLKAGEINNYSNPFYWEFLCDIQHELMMIRDIMYSRNIELPHREIAIFVLNINDMIFEKNLSKEMV